MLITKLCDALGYSKQAYYKAIKNSKRNTDFEKKVVEIVKKIRIRQPKVGARKLKRSLKLEDVIIGRDKLLDILRKNNLLVKTRRQYTKTTNSNHWYNKYSNLIKERPITSPNQVYASDITYIPTLEGFMYLFLITDMYSRKIVGYNLSDSLSSDGAILAIKKAFKELPTKEGLIHHSDRGIQYCCNDYINLLKQEKVKISMTEDDHVYENSLAERVNGILKNEFIGFNPLNNKKITTKLVEQSIDIYNNERLHMSLDYKTPNQVHCCLN